MNSTVKYYIIIVIVVGLFGYSTYNNYKVDKLGEQFCASKEMQYLSISQDVDNGRAYLCYIERGDFLLTEWVFINKYCKYDFAQDLKVCDPRYYVDTSNVIMED